MYNTQVYKNTAIINLNLTLQWTPNTELPEDLVGCPAIQCVSEHSGKYHGFNFPYGYSLAEYRNNYQYVLTDSRKEVREIKTVEEIFSIISTFPTFLEYDQHLRDQELTFLRKEISALKQERWEANNLVLKYQGIFREIRDINKKRKYPRGKIFKLIQDIV